MEDGVIKKVRTQIHEWEKAGNLVSLFNLTAEKNESVIPVMQYVMNNGISRRFLPNKECLTDIEKFNPDIIYFRFFFWNRTFSILQKKYTNILEVNTDDNAELKLNFLSSKKATSLLIFIFNYFTRKFVFSRVSALVAVTYDLAQNREFVKFNKNIYVCPNGYNVTDEFIIKKKTKYDSPELFFIGSPHQTWHGVDIIENIAREIPEYKFHIVGLNGKSTENLFFHGYLKQDEYIPILEKCCICISTLAGFRKNLLEAAPLKTREYLAKGYPIIAGYKDSAFINDELPDWILEIDTQHKSKFRDEILAFVEKNKNKVVMKEEVYNFISSDCIETKRLTFFKSIISEK